MSSAGQRALARVGRIVGKYRLERVIGVGGMAAVYAATHRDGHRVAVKFMLEHFRDDPNIEQLFGREALIANQVGHPGAVPVLSHDVDDDGSPFLVMPLLEGETLHARWQRANKRLPIAEVGVFMSDVLDVLTSAHDRGIIHRDIKPENLFLTAAGDVRVLDFGIARRIDRQGSPTITGMMIGTPAFMPPEQAIGNRDAVGPASDCWAVGATMFALLSGEFVHPADSAGAQLAAAATRPARSLAEAAPNIPAPVVAFIDKALAFDPADRWPSARAMRDAMRAAFENVLGQPVTDVARRARIEFVATWAAEAHPTEQKTRGAGEGTGDEAVRPGLASVYRLELADVEVKVRDIGRVVPLLTEKARRIYADHGLGRFTEQGLVLNPGPWWPVVPYARALHEIAAVDGSTKTFELQKLIYRHVSSRKGDPGGEDIHTAFAMADARFHASHRKGGQPMYDPTSGRMLEGIGHIRYHGEPGENFIALECDNWVPCDMQRGAQFFIARRYEPHALVEHASGSCRKRGDASCTYHITWW
ncbi:serine/threonine protein kinase [Pendulispora brunnea]|uniref:Serine/threonine protein kinase n=1 Tax=Pendulispora brunnea TaxID=2905690 RepID=A0ABZ2KKT6_9BACT